jgi:hypothetical protein
MATSHAQHAHYEGLKDRILAFLGAGIPAERVASAVGCEPSYISQLLADENFANEVSQRKVMQLTELTERDKRLDSLEDKVIAKVETALSSPVALLKPMEGIRALQMLNSLKRRGSGVDTNVNSGQVSVSIMLPTITLKQFTIDVNNQVIKADNESLVTIASGQVEKLAENILTIEHMNDNISHNINDEQSSRKRLHELSISDLE